MSRKRVRRTGIEAAMMVTADSAEPLDPVVLALCL
jgi:hypothetical protein